MLSRGHNTQNGRHYMFNPFEDIVVFHRYFGLMPTQKGLLPPDIAAFRHKFLREEVREHAEANDDHRLADSLDAMIDVTYVALGTLVLHGFSAEEMAEAWDRVHEANMKKVRAKSAADSKRGSIYDVVKPEGWTPPVLDDLCR